MKCPFCKEEIGRRPQGNQCPACGQRLLRCTVCGEVLSEKKQYCLKCGFKIPDTLYDMIPDNRIYRQIPSGSLSNAIALAKSGAGIAYQAPASARSAAQPAPAYQTRTAPEPAPAYQNRTAPEPAPAYQTRTAPEPAPAYQARTASQPSYAHRSGTTAQAASIPQAAAFADSPEIAALNNKINQNENKIQELLKELGNACYAAYKEKKDGDFKELFDKIDSLHKEIEDYKEQIKEINSAPKCPHCGGKVGEEDIFCINCGKRLVEEKPEEKTAIPDKTVCSNCGATLLDGAAFCVECGHKI